MQIINQIIYYIIFIGTVLIPPFFWLWYFRYQDKTRPEPISLLGKVFLLGGVSFIIVHFFERIISYHFKISFLRIDHIFSWLTVLILFFALLEELGKFLIMRFYVFKQRAYDEAIDGIIYGVTVGLGFAMVENLLYVYRNGFMVILFRFAMATLLHALLCGIVGYFLTIKKFKFSRSKTLTLAILAMVVVLHFIYNLIYFMNWGALSFYFAGVFVFLVFLFLIVLIIKAKKLQAKIMDLRN